MPAGLHGSSAKKQTASLEHQACGFLFRRLWRFHLHNLPLPVGPLENKAHHFQFLFGGYCDGGVFRVFFKLGDYLSYGNVSFQMKTPAM